MKAPSCLLVALFTFTCQALAGELFGRGSHGHDAGQFDLEQRQVFSLPGGPTIPIHTTVSLPGTILSISRSATDTDTDTASPSSSSSPSTDTAPTDTSSGTLNPSGSPTTSSAPTSSTPFLFFNTISSMTSCTTATVSWVYAGPVSLMHLMITNIDVDQTSAPPTSSTKAPNTYTNDDIVVNRRAVPTGATISFPDGSSGGPFIFETIADGLSPFSQTYSWSGVNVPQGWYITQANVSTFKFVSSPFFVTNGSDVSCLITNVPGTSSSSSPTGSTSTPSPSETSGTTLPVSGASSSVNKGAIAGGVIGGVALIAAVVAAYLIFRCFASTRRASATSSERAPGVMGKWGNLGSFDNTSKSKSSPTKSQKTKSKKYNGGGLGGLGFGIADPQTKKKSSHERRHNSHADSLGPIMSSSHNHQGPPTPGASAEDFNDAYSPSEEKYTAGRSPFSDLGHGMDNSGEELGMGMIPIGYESGGNSNAATPSPADASLGHPTRNSSSSSTYSYMRNSKNNYSRPRSYSHGKNGNRATSPQTFPESPHISSTTFNSSRRASSPPIPGVHPSAGEYPPPSPSPAYPSGSSRTMMMSSPSPSPGPISTSYSHSSTMAAPTATASTPVTPTARRTPRKPVPSYNPQDPTLSYPATHELSQMPPSQSSLERESSEESHRAGAAAPSGPAMMPPELLHKNSYGSFKQMHYLIPDMPPPQRD